MSRQREATPPTTLTGAVTFSLRRRREGLFEAVSVNGDITLTVRAVGRTEAEAQVRAVYTAQPGMPM